MLAGWHTVFGCGHVSGLHGARPALVGRSTTWPLRGSVVPDTCRDHPCEGRSCCHHQGGCGPSAPGAP
eukprot:12380519-Alexandrium_andersonii.AAC.1